MLLTKEYHDLLARLDEIPGIDKKSAQSIDKDLQVFEQRPLWYQVPYFITHFRADLVKGTAQNFSPGLPINLWAWGYGLLGGVLFSLIFNGFVMLPKALKKKKSLKINPDTLD